MTSIPAPTAPRRSSLPSVATRFPPLVPEYAHPLVKVALLPLTLPLALILVPLWYVERALSR